MCCWAAADTKVLTHIHQSIAFGADKKARTRTANGSLRYLYFVFLEPVFRMWGATWNFCISVSGRTVLVVAWMSVHRTSCWRWRAGKKRSINFLNLSKSLGLWGKGKFNPFWKGSQPSTQTILSKMWRASTRSGSPQVFMNEWSIYKLWLKAFYYCFVQISDKNWPSNILDLWILKDMQNCGFAQFQTM